MRRIRLHSVTLSNYRGFRDLVTLELPEKGVVLVEGRVATTGESSGAGKTGFLGAIPYVLGHGKVPTTRNVCWDRPDHDMYVSLVLLVGDTTHTATRGTRGFTLSDSEVPGVALQGKGAEAQLARILPPREFLSAMTYRPQRSVGYFLALGPTERLSFLAGLLGLDRYEAALDTLKQRARAAEDHATVARNGLQQALERLKGARACQHQPPASGELAEVAKELAAAGVSVLLEEMPPATGLRDLAAAAAADATERNRKRGLADQLIALLEPAVVVDPRLEAALIAEQISGLRASFCSQCGQPWNGSVATARLTALEANQVLVQRRIATYDNLRGQLVQARAFRDANTGSSALEMELRQRYARIGAEREAAEARNRAKIAEAEQRLSRARQRNAELCERTKLANDAVLELTAAEQYLAVTEQLIVEAERQLVESQDAVAALKGFLSAYLKDLLDDLSDRVNVTLARMPNMAGITLRFTPSKTLKNGNERWEVGVVAVVCGEERDLREDPISGGQMAAAELATDLDLRQILAERTGIHVGWQILDEPFGGLTQRTKEECLALLRERAERDGLLILLVDHAEDFKTAFDQVIEVIAGPNTTTVQMKKRSDS